MQEPELSLPKSVRFVQVGDKKIYLVGTAHVSRESVEDVRKTIEALKPDAVCVELCAARHKAIIQRENWSKMDIFSVIKEKRSLFLLAQLILNSFYRRIGEQLGVQPGAEMIEGIRQAEQHGARLVLADRDVEVTLKRVWGYLNFWYKLKMMFHLLASLFVSDKIDASLVEEMKNRDQLDNVLESFSAAFPEVKKRLIDERDVFLADRIRTAPGKTVVAVVGAGHVAGIRVHVHEEADLVPLMEIPPKSVVPAVLKWAIPALIVLLLVAGFFKGGTDYTITSICIWLLVNGILAGAGAALAFAHPLTILTAFVSAPLTSLNPLIAAGWVAALVQAWIKKPTVADLEALPEAITSVKGFWMNPVCRILLVCAFANIGSTLGTFISGSWIAARAL